jgi:hypothetical protein
VCSGLPKHVTSAWPVGYEAAGFGCSGLVRPRWSDGRLMDFG